MSKNKKEEKEDRVLVSDVFSSKSMWIGDKTIDGSYVVLETKGTGLINQIMLKSNATTYTIQVIVDDSIIFTQTYTALSEVSDHIDNISLYTAGAFDYLTIQNLPFQESFQVRIITTTSTIFSLIWIRYAIRNEIIQHIGD